MRIHYDNIGDVGIVEDQPSYNLPVGGWSEGRNVRFKAGVAVKMKGETDAFSATASISISSIFAINVITTTDAYWAYASTDKVYGTDGTTHTDISDGTYSATADINWTGGVFGGIVILNNGINCPRQWGDNSAGPSLGKPLKVLENWSSTSSTTCRFIRPYKNYLVAGDITEGGVRNPRLLAWSHPATFGTVPSSWDYADATKDAGRYEMAETNDFLVDSLPLSDINVVYKEHSTWGMQFIGAPNIFRFYQIFPDLGMLSRRCAAVFGGYQHAVFGHNDIYIHNGQTLQSIMENRMKDWIYNQIDPSTYVRSFVVPYYAEDEVWFCFPQTGQSYPNLAVIWNYRNNTTYVRELNNIAHIALGIIPNSATSWETDADTWDADSDPWDKINFSPTLKRMFASKPTQKKLYQLENSEQNDGTPFTAYVTRLGIPIGRQGMDGSIRSDVSSTKNIYAVYPRVTGTEGGVLNVYLGTQATHESSIVWTGPRTFTIATDYKVDFRTSGKLVGIKFESTTNITWTLQGFSLEVMIQGDR